MMMMVMMIITLRCVSRRCRSCAGISGIRDNTIGPQNNIRIRPRNEQSREMD